MELEYAFTFTKLQAWAGVLREAAHHPAARAVVLTGSGAAFCSGVELSAEELLDETLAFAGRLAAQPPVHVEQIESTVRRSRDIDLRTSLDLVASHMAVAMATEDHREATPAFRDRRSGVYAGR